MEAKFKATLRSCCFAETEEQHFSLLLVCLSFASLSLSASISLSLLPSFIFHPTLLWERSSTPPLQRLFLCPCLSPFSFCSRPVSCSSVFVSVWFCGTFGSLQPSSSGVLPFCISIQLSSNMPVFQIWQTLISTQQQGRCPGASLFTEPHLTPDPNRALNSKLSKDNRWSEIDSCSALPCRYLPGSKNLLIAPHPLLSPPSLLFLSLCLFSLSKMALPQMFNSNYLLIKRSSKLSIDVKASIWICNHPLLHCCCAQRNFPPDFLIAGSKS